MPTKVINSFGSGELSPLMRGRTDFSRYYNGCLTAQNVMLLPQGGAEYRAGTQFIAETKDSTKKSRLIPFVFSESIAYALEFGDLYIRFYRDGVQLGAPVEVVTPYLEADLPKIKFTQSADVMYITHPSYVPKKLSRTSDIAWTLVDVPFKNGPFLEQNLIETLTIDIDYPIWVTATSYTAKDIVRIAETAATIPTFASQTINAAAVVDNGDGTVDIADTGHGYTAGMGIRFVGTTNYDTPDFEVQTGTTVNLIRVIATFVAETPAGTETVQRFAIPENKGSGLVGFPATAHGYSEYDTVEISGTTNYDGKSSVHSSSSTNEVVIDADFVFELLDGAAAIQRIRFYKALTTHTSGAGNPTPPGNTTDWTVALTYTGTNVILTASSALFDADMVGGLWKIVHPRRDSANSNEAAGWTSTQVSTSYPVSKGTTWSFITSGTWGGNVEIRRSFNDGTTFESVRSFNRLSSNVSTSGTEEIGDALYQISFVFGSGTLFWDFNIDEFRTNGIVEITSFTSTTVMGGTVKTAVGDVLPTDEWFEGAWSTHRGFPFDVKFFDQRLVYVGHTHCPVRVWASKSDDLDNFEEGTLDDDAIVRRLDGNEINKIQFLNSLEDIIIATAGEVWRMGSSDRSEPMSPANATQRIQNNSGSADISSVVVNNSVIFADFKAEKVLDLLFDGNSGGYQTSDLTQLASHLTESTTITELAWMKNPDNYLFVVLSNGVLLTLIYRREEEIIGWSRFVTDGLVESAIVLPGDTENELHIIVNRTIDGVTKRYIERKKPQDFGFTDVTGAWFVDSGLEFDGGAAVAITGITKADPAVVTSAAHLLANTNKVRIRGVLGMTEANDVFEVANVTANTYELKDPDTSVDIDSTAWGTYTSGGTGEKVSKVCGGLSHLEAKTVRILADGAVVPDKVVSSASITLDDYANRKIIGLGYTGIIQPMPPDFDGSLSGKIKRISKMIIKLYRSAGVSAGTSATSTDELFLFDEAILMDSPTALFTGDYLFGFDGTWDRDNDLFIVFDKPLPATLLSLIYEVEGKSI